MASAFRLLLGIISFVLIFVFSLTRTVQVSADGICFVKFLSFKVFDLERYLAVQIGFSIRLL